MNLSNIILKDNIIKTNKLLIRNVKMGNDKEIHKLTYFIPYPFTLEKAKRIIKDVERERKKDKNIITFSIVLKEINKIVGVIDIFDINNEDKKAKVGYWLGRDYWGKGYASEALKAVLFFAFNKLKLRKIYAETLTINIGSIKVLKKAGFRKIGLLKKDKIIDSKKYDLFIFELLKGRS